METKLDRIAQVAKERPKERLTSLIHLINRESLAESHKEIAKGKATGVDGKTNSYSLTGTTQLRIF